MRKILLCFFLLLLFPVCALAAPKLEFIGSFESYGPMFVTTDDSGLIYVTQKENIRVLSPDGRALRDMGGEHLQSPAGIAFYQGKLYVTDTSLNRVVILSTDGQLMDAFGSRGSGPREFNKPMGIFVHSGNIYVADKGNDRVQIFGPDGIYMGSIGNDGNNKTLDDPVDVAVGPGGNVFVADGSINGLKVFDSAGKHIGYESAVKSPYSIAITGDGFYITDPVNYKVVRCDSKGKERYSFGSKGDGRAQFKSMGGIHADDSGRFYMADLKQGMVHVFVPETLSDAPEAPEAAPLTSVRWERDIEFKADSVAWSPKGDTLVAIYTDGKQLTAIRGSSAAGAITLGDAKPVAAAIDKDGNYWVADEGKDQLLKLDSKGNLLYKVGSYGSDDGKLSNPADIAITSDGIIYVADKNNHRIDVFNTDGVFLKVLKKGPPILRPIAVALSYRGLYVLDDDQKHLVLLSFDGQVLETIGGEGEGRGSFKKPVDVAATNDEVFVLDADKRSVQVFDHKGNFTREFGSEGSGKGGFSKPSSLAIADGVRLAIADPAAGRVQVLVNVYTPPRPTGFKAQAGMHQVNLTWTPTTASFVSGYRIYRSEEGPGKGFERIDEISSGTQRAYTDINAVPGNMYYYRVSAVADGGNESAMSQTAGAVPMQFSTFPPSDRQARADERSITITWSPINEAHLSHYVVYRVADDKRFKLAETKETAYTDKGLIPHTIYSYGITSVSTDGVESPMAPLEATTKAVTGPPVDIKVLEVKDVFSNAYKIYENEGIGRVRLTNNTGYPIPKLKVSFYMKEFMDFPSDQYVQNIGPGESREVDIKAVFNNLILDVTEDTPVQTEIRATYYDAQQERTFSANHPIYVYEKHRMTWDEPGRIGTFITTKDLSVLEFARSVVTQYRETDSPLVHAGMVFDAMGALGMKYLPDPNNPYQQTSGMTDFVDYVQFPRETLQRRSGDCDDLVGLYSSALESLGIETRIVLYTGHMLMMFSTGISSDAAEGMSDKYVVRDGKLWVPVEVTLVGQPFVKAWEKGAQNYKEWWESSGLYLLDPRMAWQRFKPASLRSTEWRADPVLRQSIEAAYDEYRVLVKMSLAPRTRRYVEALKETPDNVSAMHQLAIIYAQAGQPEEAMVLFERAITIRPGDAALVNDVGNVYFLEGDYENACKFYEVASQFDKEDALILVNLARCYMKLGMKDKARKAFGDAYRIQPDVSKRYSAMALDLLGEI